MPVLSLDFIGSKVESHIISQWLDRFKQVHENSDYRRVIVDMKDEAYED